MVRFNEALLNDPSLINADNHDRGWLYEIHNRGDVADCTGVCSVAGGGLGKDGTHVEEPVQRVDRETSDRETRAREEESGTGLDVIE